MLGEIFIIAAIFGAFFRAAREYGANGFLWGGVGLASFYGTFFLVSVAVGLAFGAVSVLGMMALAPVAGFVAGVAAVIFAYNKLMDRAIQAQAMRDDAASSASSAQAAGN